MIQRRLSRRQIAGILSCVLSTGLFGAAAQAAPVAAVVATDYQNGGELGTVEGSEVTTELKDAPEAGVNDSLGKDVALFPFYLDGKALFFQNSYDFGNPAAQTGYIVSPQDFKTPRAQGKIEDAPNPHAVAGITKNGKSYLYLADYDGGKIGVAEIKDGNIDADDTKTADYRRDIVDHIGALPSGDTQLHGEGTAIYGDSLYTLVSQDRPQGYARDYDNSYVLQYKIESDGSLTYKSHARIGKNVGNMRMNFFNDTLFVGAIGGAQHYGHGNPTETGIYAMKLGAGDGALSGATKITLPTAVASTQEDIRDVKVMPNGTAYVMTYNIKTGGNGIDKGHVYQTTVSNLLSDHPEEWTKVTSTADDGGEWKGWFGKIDAEHYTKRLWMEAGDELRAYTDGRTTPKKWQAKQFSGNKNYTNFNGINLVPRDRVAGLLASVNGSLPEGVAAPAPAANPNAQWQSGAVTSPVTGDTNYTADTAVALADGRALGDRGTNVRAAVFARGNDVTVNAAGQKLGLMARGYVGSPAGVYAGGAGSATVSADTLNIVTENYEGGNTLTNAVWNDAPKNGASHITLNAPHVHIAMRGGLGGNGIAVQKTDRFGESSMEAQESSTITVNGDVSIRGDRNDVWGIPLNRENVYSRFNNAGILTAVNGSRVTVNGNVDFAVYGNGVTTNAKDSKVSIGGGSILVPKGMKYGYYTLAAYKGSIAMNMGADGMTPGTNKVQLAGDIFALPTGRVDVALTTNDSYLSGIVDNGGTANLYLKNGATWTNVRNNTRYSRDSEDIGGGEQSRLTRLVGGDSAATRGIIYQKDDKPITIDKYSGHTVAVYSHNAGTPTTIKGGDIVVDKAVGIKNVFTLFTDSNGVTAANQNAVLDALAGKLTYRSHTDELLDGKLEIGEGLTSSSVHKDITFGNGGKGRFFPPGTLGPAKPITAADMTAGVYKLSNDETRVLTQADVTKGFSNRYAALAGYTKDANGNAPTDLTVDLAGHKLTLGMATSTPTNTAGILGGKEKSLTINDSAGTGRIVLEVAQTNNRMSDAIYTDQKSIVNINAHVDIKSVKAKYQAHGIYAGNESKVTLKKLTIREVVGENDHAVGFNVYGIGAGKGAKVNVDEAHISGVKGSALYAMTTGDAKTEINVGGGRIIAEASDDNEKNYWAVYTANGNVTLNKDKNRDLTVVGNMQAGGTSYTGTIGASFATAASSWAGAMGIGKIGSKANLTVSNGAVWTNELQKGALAKNFTGSHLTNFTGGSTEGAAGIVRQFNDKALTIDNYSGHAKFVFRHTGTTVAGGDVKIAKAATGSGIVLSTDSVGVTAANTNAVFDALAKKLTYSDYAHNPTNLTGKLEIAEGLTGSSIAKKFGALSFESTGRGKYDSGAPQPEPPAPPSTEQNKTSFTKKITPSDVTEYKDANVEKEAGVYTFTKDSTLNYAGSVGAIEAGYRPLTIDAEGHTLTVNVRPQSASPMFMTAMQLTSGKDVSIDAGRLVLNVNADRTPGLTKVFGINMQSDKTLSIKGMTEINTYAAGESFGVRQAGFGKALFDGLKVTINKNATDGRSLSAEGRRGSNALLAVNVKNGVVGKSEVQLDGNLYTGSDAYGRGRLDLALTTATSYLNGLSIAEQGTWDDGGTQKTDRGIVNLYLQNGARWTNANYSNAAPAGFTGSYVEKFTGGASADKAGVVFQNDAKPISIDQYRGHAKFFYAHNTATPTVFAGGDLRIRKAADDSAATLLTDSNGVTAANTESVLTALAKKLYYTGYTKGDRALKGQVGIAEGLTVSSAIKKLGDVTYDETTGRGIYAPGGFIPGDQTKNNFTTAITGTAADTEYTAAKVRKAAGYIFTKEETTITPAKHVVPAIDDRSAGISNVDPNKELKLDLKYHKLTLNVGSDTHTAGIAAGAKATVTVQNAGDVNVAAESTNGGAASALYATGGGHIRIKNGGAEGGLLTLRARTEGADGGAVIRAIGTAGAASSVTVEGGSDVFADGAAADGKGAKNAVHTTGADIRLAGGTIRGIGGATALRAEGNAGSTGRIYVNAAENAAGTATGAGTRDTVIEGDVVTGAGGAVNLGLGTQKSAWTGNYASAYGALNAFLKGGATWTGAATGKNLSLSLESNAMWKERGTSSVKNFDGNKGFIDMTDEKSGDLMIENYKGSAAFLYRHNASDPTTMYGGNITVKNAAAGSEITLRTDMAGLAPYSSNPEDMNLMDATFNALANKLFYIGYANGERNLKGILEIAEGLTTPGARKKVQQLTYKQNGQGRHLYTPRELPPPTEEITRGQTLTADRLARAEYPNAKGGTLAAALYSDRPTTKTAPMTLDMAGHNLNLEANSDRIATGIYAGNNDHIEIKNSKPTGKISITAENIDTRAAAGIYADTEAHLTVNAPVDIRKVTTNGDAVNGVHIQGQRSKLVFNGALSIAGLDAKRGKGAGMNAAGIRVTGQDSSVIVNGKVNITGVKGSGLALAGANGTISVQGGTIAAAEDADRTKHYAAVRADKGTVNINMAGGAAGTTTTNITGDMYLTREYGKRVPEYSPHGTLVDFENKGVLNLALTDAASTWHGAATYAVHKDDYGTGGFTARDVGTFNLHLQNGAHWTNEVLSGTDASFAGSRVTKLTGGSDAAHAGVITQKDAKNITVDAYGGHTRVLYAHDAAHPTAMQGGDLVVKNAAAGSAITMTTDSTGLNTTSTKAADKNLVSETLDALAKKLYYTAYKSGERNLTGKTEIAEGLTASSASRRIENITFNTATGQGGYAYTPAVDPTPQPNPEPKPEPQPQPQPQPKPEPKPEGQTQTAFTQGITGDAAADKAYADGGVLKNGKYTFSKVSTITADTGIAAPGGKTVSVADTATLTITAKNYGIDAAANGKMDVTGERLVVKTTGGKDSRSIRAAAGSAVTVNSGFDIMGAIENNGGTVKLSDMGKTSSLVGDITQTAGSFDLTMKGKNSRLESEIVSQGGDIRLTVAGDGATFTGSIRSGARGASFFRASDPIGTRTLSLGAKSIWNVTGVSELTTLNAEQGSTINQQSKGEIRLGTYSGNAKVVYKGTVNEDGTLKLQNVGRISVQKIAGKNNTLTLATDAAPAKADDAAERKVAAELAKRFVYRGDTAEIVDGAVKGLELKARIADGITKSQKTYGVTLDAQGRSKSLSTETDEQKRFKVEYGDYETKLMSGVKSAMTASAMAWRAESNDLMKRLGDLRLSPEQIGTWVRFYRGKSSGDKDRADFRMNYSTIQVGHDWKVSPSWRVGVAGSYMKGSASYASGSGKNKEGNFGVYGTWTGKSGQYVDLIAKVGRLTNDYTVYNDFGHYVKGDYGAWGGSLSAEYGKRIRGKNGSFIEPQAEMIYTHLNGVHYGGNTDYQISPGVYQQMFVRQSAFNSLIGRIGIGVGQETARSTWFAKVSLYHEFAGSLHTDYSDGINPWKRTNQDYKDTWVGAQIGGTVKVGEKCSVYGDFEKTFGGDIKTAWRMDAGVRWSF